MGTEHLFEDFVDLLDPVMWIFLIYALLQYASKKEMQDEIHIRQQTETALKTSREKLILTMRGAALTLWEWNLKTGEIVFHDPEDIEKLRVDGQDHGHKFLWKYTVHPDDLDLVKDKWRLYSEGETAVFEAVYRHKLSGIKWSWVLCRGKAIAFDEQGEPWRAIGTHLDISEQKNLEAQLLQSQKMESVGQLAGGVAHDFNNLLMAILGYCELLMDKVPAGNPTVHDVLEIKKAGDRAALLTRQLLAYSRKQILAPKILDLNELILGMEAPVVRKIFDPFFSTKEKDKGTGLGLSTVHGIVKQSGGHITVYSEPGRGTTFNVYLPRVSEDNESQPAEIDIRDRLDGNETILIVEDEAVVKNLIAKTLEEHGYRALVSVFCDEAFESVKAHGDEIQLLITDVVLPVMSGKELAKKTHETMPHLNVLYISGYTENATVHHGILETDVHFLQKPFPPKRLLQTIRNILDGQ